MLHNETALVHTTPVAMGWSAGCDNADSGAGMKAMKVARPEGRAMTLMIAPQSK
jgi:hypothetical protein